MLTLADEVADLPSLAEFRRVRDESTVATWTARLPELKARIADLRAQINALNEDLKLVAVKRGNPALTILQTAALKHQREHVDGERIELYWKLQPLDAEYGTICRELPGKQWIAENCRAIEDKP